MPPSQPVSLTLASRGYACNSTPSPQPHEATLGCISSFSDFIAPSVTLMDPGAGVTTVVTNLSLAGAYDAFSIQVRTQVGILQPVRTKSEHGDQFSLFIADLSVFCYQTPSSTTDPQSSDDKSSTTTSPSSNDLDTSDKIAIGVGVPVGVATIVAAWISWKLYRRKKSIGQTRYSLFFLH